MSKLAASLMSSAANSEPAETSPETATQAPRRYFGRSQGKRHSQSSSRQRRTIHAGDDGDDDDAAEPDRLVPDPEVCREFGISAMTLWRWDRDAALAALGWPPPVIIRKRKFRQRRALEAFKRAMVRRAIEARAVGGAAPATEA
jgi:hypothetical protein